MADTHQSHNLTARAVHRREATPPIAFAVAATQGAAR
jgi:hypothetical protein